MKKRMYESPEILMEEIPAENGFLGSNDENSQFNDMTEVDTDWN